jgi:mono/diheme cytochrome c family protein
MYVKLLAILVILIFSSCQKEKMEEMKVSGPNPVQGKALYTKYCHQCHGLLGTGSILARFLLPSKKINLDQKKFQELILNGREGTYMKSHKARLNLKHIESIRLYLSELSRINKEKK